MSRKEVKEFDLGLKNMLLKDCIYLYSRVTLKEVIKLFLILIDTFMGSSFAESSANAPQTRNAKNAKQSVNTTSSNWIRYLLLHLHLPSHTCCYCYGYALDFRSWINKL